MQSNLLFSCLCVQKNKIRLKADQELEQLGWDPKQICKLLRVDSLNKFDVTEVVEEVLEKCAPLQRHKWCDKDLKMYLMRVFSEEMGTRLLSHYDGVSGNSGDLVHFVANYLICEEFPYWDRRWNWEKKAIMVDPPRKRLVTRTRPKSRNKFSLSREMSFHGEPFWTRPAGPAKVLHSAFPLFAVSFSSPSLPPSLITLFLLIESV